MICSKVMSLINDNRVVRSFIRYSGVMRHAGPASSYLLSTRCPITENLATKNTISPRSVKRSANFRQIGSETAICAQRGACGVSGAARVEVIKINQTLIRLEDSSIALDSRVPGCRPRVPTTT